jgi:hypothetical protein
MIYDYVSKQTTRCTVNATVAIRSTCLYGEKCVAAVLGGSVYNEY